MGLPLNGQSATIHVNSYQIKKWYHFDEQQKGSNMISLLSITKGYYYSPKPDVDASVVYAVPKGIRNVLHLSESTRLLTTWWL